MSRDILAPPRMRMAGGRCYRVNLIHEDFGSTGQRQRKGNEIPAHQGYVEQDLYTEDYDDEEGIDDNIEDLNSGFFKLAMHVPNSFFGGIIGFKGSTKRRIESETNTEIFVPRIREGSSGNPTQKNEVTIKANSKDKILAARRQINILTSSLRNRMKKTHFLGVAFRGTEVQQRFTDFKEKVLSLNMPGIVEELFQKDDCIHVTVEACVLLDEIERKKAIDLLHSTKDFLPDLKTPFEVKVKGLEIMNDDPSAVRILYACVESSDLQVYADKTAKLFQKAGFSYDKFQKDSIKMHMTVMKTGFLQNSDNNNYNQNFDAREILKRFGDFEFGSALCDEVFLFVLNSKAEKKEFYKISGSLKLI